MSLRVKKSTNTKKLVAADHCTPPKSVNESLDRIKPKSSMKKLKKFLKSHSRCKSSNVDSPSIVQLEGAERATVNKTVDAAVSKNQSKKESTDGSSANLFRDRPLVKRSHNDAKLNTDIVEKPTKRFRRNSGTSLAATPHLPSSSSISSYEVPKAFPVMEPDKLFQTLISPVTEKQFFKEIWQQKPLLIRRHNAEHNKDWFSTEELDRILHEKLLKFGNNIDVVTYVNGKRETHNPEGRAYAPLVWDYYQNGCSVRLLNPHTYSKNVWNYLSLLQEYFGCVAGSNIYLTPPGSQGFAPHWDDIEAFVLQLEGKKHWRVYEPRYVSDIRQQGCVQQISEKRCVLLIAVNFSDADLTQPPVLETVLEPGDLLYFPRGFIHQGRTMEDAHSLHITVSVGQKNTWGDLLQKLLPGALEIAIEDDVDFRRSLPCNYLNYMGVAFSDESSTERSKFLKTIEQLIAKLLLVAPVDAACDQMAKQFLRDSLPPVLSPVERQLSIHGQGEHWDAKSKCVRGAVEIEPDTEIRVIRRGSIRLITEENKVFIYHNMENTRMLHGEEVQCTEVEPQMAEAVEFLLKRYPDFVNVDSLPLDTVQERVGLAADLYDRGLIMTQEPLESLSDDDSACGSLDVAK